MKTLFIISSLFFYISYGTTLIIDYENKKGYYPHSKNFIDILSFFSCYIIPVISFCYIFNISWYWLAILNFVICFTISYPIARIYCFIFGIKTKPHHIYETGKFGKQHMYEYDVLLSLIIAIILFILALNT